MTLSHIFSYLRRMKFPLFGIFIWVFIDQGIGLAKGNTAFSSTYWMQIFSYQDYTEPQDFYQYLLDLRTGIPPLYSALEIYSFNTWEDSSWIFQNLYQGAIIVLVLLPLFFSKGKGVLLLWGLLTAWVIFRSILLIHPGNPQYYDVLLPVFLLLFILLTEASLATKEWKFFALIPAFLAGLSLSIAELSRPFMLALLPILVVYSLFHFIQHKQWLLVGAFLLPLLMLSGGWHGKLFMYNNGQIIWSNSSGTNLYRAWSEFVDSEALNKELQKEEEPLMWGRWDNLNTQVHYENSQVRKKYVWEGIRKNPGKALMRIWKKTLIFIQPQTDIYDHKPRGSYIAMYSFLVKGLFLVFPILLFLEIRQLIKKPHHFFSRNLLILIITGFLSLMPIIGESGEEARFLVSVLPFLMILGMIGLEKIATLVQNSKLNGILNFP